jgi:D-inositol-3-phosphate glycosyltransferase
MKRIAMISEHASPLAALGGADCGGQNVYVDQLSRHLAARGYAVDVFTRRDDRCLPEVVERHGVRVVHVPAGPAERLRKEELLPFMDDFTKFMLRFGRRHGAYQLLHANFFMSALVAAEVKRHLGTPFVVTFHALGRIRLLHQGEADACPRERLAIEDRVVAEADRIIAECPQDVEDLVTHYRASRTRLRTIPCGFDPAEFAPLDKEAACAALGIDPAPWTVLQLGRMVPRKGVDTVIRAVACLRRAYDTRARLLVVGGESREPDPRLTPELGRLQELAAAEGISDQVVFVGSRGRSELRTYYAAADVFVTTPWYEPFGITPIEAMACGRPVIGAAVGGIKYTVSDGETGFLTSPRDPMALAERLARLERDRRLAARLGARGVQRANVLFTWGRVARLVSRLYEEVAPARRRLRVHGRLGARLAARPALAAAQPTVDAGV